MALRDPSPKLTYEDYVLLPDDGKRHEIIDGEHYVTAAPFVPHQDVSFNLTLEVGGWVRAPQARPLPLRPTDVVQPDLL